MDEKVERNVRECLVCQASTKENRRDPLQPTTAPKEPWKELAMDHWGPTEDRKHLLVVVDKTTRYPEVEVVEGTSAADNIRALDSIFGRHGNPETIYTDNGPPFNGGPSHWLQRYLKQEGIKHRPNVSGEDPEANGLAEAFMKHLKKIWHTAVVSEKDPYMEINRHLKMVRATPHPTTGKAPAELLFGRRFQTKVPDLRRSQARDREDLKEAQEKERRHDRRFTRTGRPQSGDTTSRLGMTS